MKRNKIKLRKGILPKTKFKMYLTQTKVYKE